MFPWLSEDTWGPTGCEWCYKAESGVASSLVVVKDSGVGEMIGYGKPEKM